MPGPVGLHSSVRIEDPRSELVEQLLPRVLSPLGAETLRRRLAARPKAATSIDVSRDHLTVYVPKTKPPDGYGVLVFIPPWPDATLPVGWASVLNRRGVIFATPAHAGNDKDILGRRMPLALLALDQIRSRYPIDAARTYVGGFSGGARVAFRLAVAYPEVFRGAFLNAGSDPFGTSLLSPPDPSRMAYFRTTRLVFVTGTDDPAAAAIDDATMTSLHHRCISNYVAASVPYGTHEIAKPAYLDRALAEMAKPSKRDDAADNACQIALKAEHSAMIEQVERALAKDDRVAARRLLLQLDREVGGSVGSGLITLADRCKCGLLEVENSTPPGKPSH